LDGATEETSENVSEFGPLRSGSTISNYKDTEQKLHIQSTATRVLFGMGFERASAFRAICTCTKHETDEKYENFHETDVK
jgi:hypothetical protein